MNSFGQKLKELRRRKLLTRTELSKRCGLSVRSIRAYESSERRATIQKMHLLSQGLQLTHTEHGELQAAAFSGYITGQQPRWSQFSLDGLQIGAVNGH